MGSPPAGAVTWAWDSVSTEGNRPPGRAAKVSGVAAARWAMGQVVVMRVTPSGGTVSPQLPGTEGTSALPQRPWRSECWGSTCFLIPGGPHCGYLDAQVAPQVRCHGRRIGSVTGRFVADDDEADDLAVADAEVVRQDELRGQGGLVEGAVVGPADDGVAVVVQHLTDVDADLVADHLPGDPAADRCGAGKLAAGVVDVGIRGECRHDGIGVARIDRGDVPGDDAGQLGGAHSWLLFIGAAAGLSGGPSRDTLNTAGCRTRRSKAPAGAFSSPRGR